jgi:putative transposase
VPLLTDGVTVMGEQTLRQRIAGGETATVEFKSSAARPIDIAVRMCGIANNRAGGLIIFGIEDATRAIIGIRNPSLTNDVILRAARMIKPALPITETSVQTWMLDDCTLVTVEIAPNSGRLYQYDGACYVRRGTNTVPLSVEEISAYLNNSGLARWELALGPDWMTIDDLDLDVVERYLAYRAERSRNRKCLGEASALLPALKAVNRDPATGELRPTHAGILMFGLDPQLPLPQSEVVCIKYADPLGVRHYIDRKNFRGTLPELIDQASRFLTQYTRVGATIRGFYREDEPEYPYEALREAVVNLRSGWLYLVAILDWYARYVVRWALDDTLELPFVLDAVGQALARATPQIWNSDQGSQFTSPQLIGLLEQAGAQISMDGRGRAFDNSFTERFWRSWKYEEVYLHDYGSPREARQGIAEYIRRSTHERPHQVLDYRRP